MKNRRKEGVTLASDVRDLYKRAISDIFEALKSVDSSPELVNFFSEAEKSLHLLISSAPEMSVLNEILLDAYNLAEKAASLMKPSVGKKLKRIRNNYEALIERIANKSLILSEEKRLGNVSTQDLICPNCGESVSANADFCPHCGNEMVKCTLCNLIIGGNQELEICPNCGEPAHLDCMVKNGEKCPKCGAILNG